jgi:hypothetical protein
MFDGPADAPEPATATPVKQPAQPMRSTLVVALCLGAALFGVVRLAERIAPSDAELAAIVLVQADTVTARRALHALIAREMHRNRPSAGLDDVIPRLAPADRAFLAQYRPDLLRRGRGEPR